MIRAMLIAGLGGFMGTCIRYLINQFSHSVFQGNYPLGTFLVNILGCFVIGVLTGLVEKNQLLSSQMSLLLITGFCGGLTTFSTFANDIFTLTQSRQIAISLFYVVATFTFSMLLVWAGRCLVK